jgi:hypothetical protein
MYQFILALTILRVNPAYMQIGSGLIAFADGSFTFPLPSFKSPLSIARIPSTTKMVAI